MCQAAQSSAEALTSLVPPGTEQRCLDIAAQAQDTAFKPYFTCFSTVRVQLLGARLLGSCFGSQHLCYWHYTSAGKILIVPKYRLQGFCSITAAKQGDSRKLPQEPRKPSFSCVSLPLCILPVVYPSRWACASHRQFQPALKQIKTTHCVPELQPGTGAHGASAKIFRKEWQPLGQRHKRRYVKRQEDTQDETVKR